MRCSTYHRIGYTMICFLFRTSLILPTHSLHCVLLQRTQSLRGHRLVTQFTERQAGPKKQTHHLLLLKR